MKNSLIELNCRYNCGIDQKGINELIKLEKLYAWNNSKITDVNHLRNSLVELNCEFDCGIDQKGINELIKLEKLNANYNEKITDITHLKNLKN